MPFQVERSMQLKRKHPRWGALKLREKLIRQYPQIKPPTRSTVHAILDRHGLVKRRKRRRYRAQGTPLYDIQVANGLWCADYKGEFRLGNKRYCYPLTITDYHTRYLLSCEGLESTKEMYALSVFEEVFKEFGLPNAIRTDNGIPFSCPNALFGLSKLSIWWLRLGINIERIAPGNPQQNGRHERMHLTLKNEATNPPGYSFLQQQGKFDGFINEYNNERPRQSLNMKYPAELYTPSTKVYRPPEEPEYPYHDKVIRVTQCGRICLNSKKISFSRVFAGQLVGVREVNDKIWLAGRPYPSFLEFDLGYFDEDDCRVEPLDNPFADRVLPM